MHTQSRILFASLALGLALTACGSPASPPASSGGESAAPTASTGGEAAAPAAQGPVSAEVTTLDTLKNGFSPAEVTAAPGQTVSLKLNNSKGLLEHSWVLGRKGLTEADAALIQPGNESSDTLFSLGVKPGETASGEFTAPADPGEYLVFCHIAGHTAAGMVGKLIVK